ncbi:MAG: substrate-binding domain-containing protein [Planctomycetota bacterium]|nr:substrate-binding domain-containing protein [Planctomycetota bacterium]
MLRLCTRLSVSTSILLGMILACGCTNGSSSGTSSGSGTGETTTSSGASTGPVTSRGTIGFSALTLKNPFFKIIADSMTAEGKQHGFEVLVNDAERDVNEQAKHIDNYIAQRVAAIVLNPADRIAIGPAIRKANEAGIPVFTCDLQCAADDVKIAGHIGTDNYQGGRLAGDAMVEALGEAGGEVLILHFKQANSCVLRVQGFNEAIAEVNNRRQNGKIEVVSELEGGGLRDEGFKAASDALQAHQNLRGIFAINDPSALGAWTALKQAEKLDQVTIIGFDGQLEGKQAILEGKIFADPIQFPKKMGVVSVQNILKYIDGEEYEQIELIPTELYKKADAEKDPELQSSPAPAPAPAEVNANPELKNIRFPGAAPTEAEV